VAVVIEGEPIFATRLSELMKQRGVTQAGLAGHLGRTQTAVSYWCAGKRQPSLSDLCRIAAVFDVTTDYLLGRDVSSGGSVCQHDSTRVDGLLDDCCLKCGVSGYWHRGHRHDVGHPSGKVLIRLNCSGQLD
jgi:DNA-binding XRE family transcriptional regulator